MFSYLKNSKVLIAFSYDAFVTILVFFAALSLRFDVLNPLDAPVQNIFTFMGIVVFGQITFFLLMGLYKGVWRYSSLPDLSRVIRASVFGTSLSVAILFFWNRLEGIPRSVIIIDLILLIVALGGGRFLYRLLKDHRETKKALKKRDFGDSCRVLIVGAGDSGNQLVREMLSKPMLGLIPVGMVDDNLTKKGRTLQGIRVLGTTTEIPELVKSYAVKKIFIATPSATSEQMKNIVHHCQKAGVDYKTLPKLNDILSGRVELSLLRNINLEDLLGREPVKLDLARLEGMIMGRTIMVTGAGGSIGSELCNQISKFKPERVVLFELSEFFLYELELNLTTKYPEVEFVPCIGDVRSKQRVEHVMELYRPSLVFHAAAYKHVPMMEKNPLEAIITNVFGTKTVAEAASKFEVEKFVMVSTDKAVNPTNIMGTSKRVAEMVCQWMNEASLKTQFVTVRFGNVLGSNGSVIPLFKRQIQNGGPVTVTHPDIERYFMSIPEACQLVLQTTVMGRGGEIFVLDMGSPVRIVDLAKELISLSGLKVDDDIEIKFTGLRPGEKLYEELFSAEEQLSKTDHKKVKIANSRKLIADFDHHLDKLLSLNTTSSRKEIYFALMAIVTEFSPDEMNLQISKSIH